MTGVERLWNQFWFAPRSPLAMSVYRIVFGLLVLQYCLLIAPDLLTYFGKGGILSAQTAQVMQTRLQPSLLFLFPESDAAAISLFALLIVAAIGLTFGLFTRLSAFVVFICLLSFHNRCPVILNSGDTFMLLVSLYLSFSNAGDAISFDCLVNAWKSGNVENRVSPISSPLAQRLIQMQISAVYLQSYFSKIFGTTWQDGTAIYYAVRLQEFWKFQLPILANQLWFSKLLAWFTLTAEFALGTIIWIRRYRYLVLMLGVILHIGIDLAMNIPQFEWLMITAYITFLDTSTLVNLGNKIKHLLNKSQGKHLTIVFDDRNSAVRNLVAVLVRLDILDRLAIRNATDSTGDNSLFRGTCIVIHSSPGAVAEDNLSALRKLTADLPLLRPWHYLLKLPFSNRLFGTLANRLPWQMRFFDEPVTATSQSGPN